MFSGNWYAWLVKLLKTWISSIKKSFYLSLLTTASVNLRNIQKNVPAVIWVKSWGMQERFVKIWIQGILLLWCVEFLVTETNLSGLIGLYVWHRPCSIMGKSTSGDCRLSGHVLVACRMQVGGQASIRAGSRAAQPIESNDPPSPEECHPWCSLTYPIMLEQTRSSLAVGRLIHKFRNFPLMVAALVKCLRCLSTPLSPIWRRWTEPLFTGKKSCWTKLHGWTSCSSLPKTPSCRHGTMVPTILSKSSPRDTGQLCPQQITTTWTLDMETSLGTIPGMTRETEETQGGAGPGAAP